MKTKVNIDVSSLSGDKLTGVSVYVQNLIKNLISISKSEPNFELKGVYKISRFKNREKLKNRSRLKLSLPHIPFLYPLVSENNTIYHGPDFWIPNEKGFKKIVTIHDLSVFNEGLWSGNRMESSQKTFTNMILKGKPDHIITVSEFIKAELIGHFPHLVGRVTAIYHGADHIDRFQNLKPIFDFPYIICTGTIEKRKNTAAVFEAFCQISDQYPDLKLVLAGGWHGYMGEEIIENIKKHSLKDKVILTGYISDFDLQSMIKFAQILVYPSIYEGFGFPILEGMKLSVPVVCANFGAMSEIANNAALKVNCFEYSEIAKAIKIILDSVDVKKSMIEKGLKHCETFTWQKCAKQTLKIYQNL